MQQCAWTFRYSPSARMFFSVCAASSRVGLSTSACTLCAGATGVVRVGVHSRVRCMFSIWKLVRVRDRARIGSANVYSRT